MLDGWDDGLVDDSPPWIGLAALTVGTAAVVAGVLTVAGLLVAGAWLHGKVCAR